MRNPSLDIGSPNSFPGAQPEGTLVNGLPTHVVSSNMNSSATNPGSTPAPGAVALNNVTPQMGLGDLEKLMMNDNPDFSGIFSDVELDGGMNGGGDMDMDSFSGGFLASMNSLSSGERCYTEDLG